MMMDFWEKDIDFPIVNLAKIITDGILSNIYHQGLWLSFEELGMLVVFLAMEYGVTEVKT